MRQRYRATLAAKRRAEWRPHSVEEVRALLADPNRRAVYNEDDLLDLILESLERLQRKLTGQTLPAVLELWNHDGAGNNHQNFRPKEEEHLSDHVARWLSRRKLGGSS